MKTKKEFIREWVQNLQLDPEAKSLDIDFFEEGVVIDGLVYAALDCNCSRDECQGWVMAPLIGALNGAAC